MAPKRAAADKDEREGGIGKLRSCQNVTTPTQPSVIAIAA
jgi:hypothetical protein